MWTHKLDPTSAASLLTPRILPRRIISLQDPGRPYAATSTATATAQRTSLPLPPVPERAAAAAATAKIKNSYSLPAGLTAQRYAHGSRHDPVRVSAPQNLDNDEEEEEEEKEERHDRESQSARIVRSSTTARSRSRSRRRRSFSTTSYLFLASANEEKKKKKADEGGGGRGVKVYNYMPGGYWAGRLSGLLDRLAAEMPGVAPGERVVRAFGALDVMACGPGAEQSLLEFKKTFDKRLKEGRPW